MDINVWVVFGAAMITALCTGLGALPFLVFKDISKRTLGIANAAAAGLMLGASIGLIYEGLNVEDMAGNSAVWRLALGVVVGIALILLVRAQLDHTDEAFHIGRLEGADAAEMLLIVGVMTAHSFAEGISVGVSYGDGATFGTFISLAIAIHNIPEGLAISLVLIPRGASVLRAAGWSIFSSLPQPIMAVPAYLFVLIFRPFLPFGLGLAAGAMIYMVFRELLPEAMEDVKRRTAYVTMGIAVAAMLAFQAVIG